MPSRIFSSICIPEASYTINPRSMARPSTIISYDTIHISTIVPNQKNSSIFSLKIKIFLLKYAHAHTRAKD